MACFECHLALIKLQINRASVLGYRRSKNICERKNYGRNNKTPNQAIDPVTRFGRGDPNYPNDP